MAGYHRAAVELRKASSVAVCAHVKPDGDAIGSVLALTLALKDAGIPAVPVLADAGEPPPSYEFLPGFGLYVSASQLDTPEVFVALDTPNLERLGCAADLARGASTVIVLDHHPDNAEFGSVNVVDSHAAATGLMVWRLVRALELEPSPEVALCCWVALLTDTGRFAYSNTSPDALRDGAAMLEAGVDAAEAHHMVYENRTPAALALEARVLSRLATANGGRVAYAWVADEDYPETGAHRWETEHLVDMVRTIGDIDVAILARVHPGSVRVNLRAKTGFDVSAVARHFGGGGHVAAAGFTYAGSLEEMLREVLAELPGGEYE
ncbi:MAG: DHHA1 domain-containing protein [Coriobacteriia bacterium]|nr:DHHA1 domain-containing protein [Coriobacteriia bacterium]